MKNITTPQPAPTILQTLDTQLLRIVDANGKLRVSIDAANGIRLWSDQGDPCAGLGFLANGRPFLMLVDRHLPRVLLRLDDDGQPSFITLSDTVLQLAGELMAAASPEPNGADQGGDCDPGAVEKKAAKPAKAAKGKKANGKTK